MLFRYNMIIGINGKIGSGKNLTGSIIQYLTIANPYKVQFNENIDYSVDTNWKQKAFARKLKEVISILTGCTLEELESQEFKDKVIGKDWGHIVDHIDLGGLIVGSEIKLYTYRYLLQKIGTEAMRDTIHKDIWVNALFSDYIYKYINMATAKEASIEDYNNYLNKLDSKAEIIMLQESNWIITDLRFPNELNAINDRNGFTIRINRDNGTRAIDLNPHESEKALNNAVFNYTIDNNGTIDDLIEKVREILTIEKII